MATIRSNQLSSSFYILFFNTDFALSYGGKSLAILLDVVVNRDQESGQNERHKHHEWPLERILDSGALADDGADGVIEDRVQDKDGSVDQEGNGDDKVAEIADQVLPDSLVFESPIRHVISDA